MNKRNEHKKRIVKRRRRGRKQLEMVENTKNFNGFLSPSTETIHQIIDSLKSTK